MSQPVTSDELCHQHPCDCNGWLEQCGKKRRGAAEFRKVRELTPFNPNNRHSLLLFVSTCYCDLLWKPFSIVFLFFFGGFLNQTKWFSMWPNTKAELNITCQTIWNEAFLWDKWEFKLVCISKEIFPCVATFRGRIAVRASGVLLMRKQSQQDGRSTSTKIGPNVKMNYSL